VFCIGRATKRNGMIHSKQALEIIKDTFPELKKMQTDTAAKPFKCFESVTEFAISLLADRDHTKIKTLYKTVENIYSQCEPTLAMAIENIFLYKIGEYLELKTNKKELLELLPAGFQKIVFRQYYAPGI
jgi:hypothetical protein